jgi:hypothetical protein
MLLIPLSSELISIYGMRERTLSERNRRRKARWGKTQLAFNFWWVLACPLRQSRYLGDLLV